VPEAPAAAALAIEARALAHRYGRRQGLAPVSFSLCAPGLAAVTGPNGSGKSTLMRILAGLLRPNGGEVEVRLEGAAWRPEARRLSAGFASPEVMLYDEMSVAENLRFAAQGRGLAGAEGAVRDAMARFGLEASAFDRVASLSSGWRQRARLAFALLGDPVLVLLDEPGSHLDEDGRHGLEEVLAELAGERLVVIATNDEREWSRAGTRVDLAGDLGRPR
jgi:ABC-type multidrug transport system ATPase subunit